MYFWSDVFKVRWDGFRRCTQKGATHWPRTGCWIQYRTEGCGAASRIERPNPWWPLKHWRMIRIVRIGHNPLTVSASSPCTPPAVASLWYLSNVLSAPSQHRFIYHFWGTFKPRKFNQKSWWVYNSKSPWKQKFGLEIFCVSLTSSSHSCLVLPTWWDTAPVWQHKGQGGKSRCVGSYHICEFCPTGPNFDVVPRNLVKLSILCSFIQCLSLGSRILTRFILDFQSDW